MSCSICGTQEIYCAKRNLCRKCYGREYIKGRKGSPQAGRMDIRHIREIEFVKQFFKHSNWSYSPVTFHFGDINYTPDFYDGETNTFIEVAGSRQAYHINKSVYALLRETYPKLQFEVRMPNGVLINEGNDRIDWSATPENKNQLKLVL